MQGPILNFGSPQSKYASAFLELVAGLLTADPNYVARLQRHYQMFKATVEHEPSLREPMTGPIKRIEKPKRKKKTSRGRR